MPDWITAGAAVVAVAISIAAFVRSGRATTAAEDSAVSARESADEARRIGDVEIRREHDRLAPNIRVTFRRSDDGSTVVARAFNETGRTYIVNYTVITAGDGELGEPGHRVFMAHGSQTFPCSSPGTGKTLKLACGAAEDWEHPCPCSRPAGEGHWVVTFPIKRS